MNKFYTISKNQYNKDTVEEAEQYIQYSELKLPKRATKNAAGYDFFSPLDFSLAVGETIKISTGVKISLDTDLWLLIGPRSGHGFNYRIQLDNSFGVIDSDYFDNRKNEGHIYVKITNDGKEGKTLFVKKGEAFCQGIILPYFLTEDDEEGSERVGGLGSTTI